MLRALVQASRSGMAVRASLNETGLRLAPAARTFSSRTPTTAQRLESPKFISRPLLSAFSAPATISRSASSLHSRVASRFSTVAADPAPECNNGHGKGERGQGQGDKWVASWLFGCSGLVFGMVVVGGLTRLTKSGLSMTDWKFSGEKPPITAQEWEAEFENYKSFPEYEQVHKGMTVNEFKFIYFMEWGHRMLGRVVGVSFLVPLLYFSARGRLTMPGMRLQPRLFGILGLIVGQGLVGWWMVKSGLEKPKEEWERVKVSPYRLASHLLSAFGIYTLMFTTGMRVWTGTAVQATKAALPKRVAVLLTATTALVGTTVASGAFVAGNGAGLCYNEFPKMGGRWIPEDIINPYLIPKWRNIFENSTLVQFDHRVLGISTAAAVSGLVLVTRQLPGLTANARLASSCLLGMVGVQVSLGISTLLLYVPTHLAATHQAGSLVLLSMCLWLRHALLYGRQTLPASVAQQSVGLGAGGSTLGTAAAARAFSTLARGSSTCKKPVPPPLIKASQQGPHQRLMSSVQRS